MCVVAVLRVARQLLVLIGGVRIVKSRQPVVPTAILRRQSAEESFAKVGEVVCGAVALRVRVVELVAQLQEGGLPERLAVGGLHRIAVFLRRRNVVAVGLVCRVVAQLVLSLVQVHVVGRQLLAVAVGIAKVATQRNVASFRV